ncbi:uncharacterized protein RJT21DRAFT_45275 [Scheffersomyces amazonensis]|uniref:uncharacterized protein n=1 Tax=Scheffersomyces amazonensis TaxID=1078765 RepID=UPI00315C72A2
MSQEKTPSKAEEAGYDKKPIEDAPPPAYDELDHNYSRPPEAPPQLPQQPNQVYQQSFQQGYQQGYQQYQQYQQLPPTSGSSYAPPPQGYQQQGYAQPPPPQGYDPMQDPNVVVVGSDLVNITQARPQYLNPSYQQYLARDQQRIQQGDIPNPKGKLNTGTQNPTRKDGSGFFPGRSGVTYNNAANK